MIDPALLMHDSLSDPAFKKAVHQNNLYMFQECMRSAPGNASSEKLLKVQKILETLSKATITATSPTLAQQIQDALAVENIYLDIEQINKYFIDVTTGTIKTSLTDTTASKAHDAAWGCLALTGMKDAVAGYNAHKEGDSTTKQAYVALEKHLQSVEVMTKGVSPEAKNRHDLWVDIEKTDSIAKDEAKDDYMANFAKKAGFTQKKIERHYDYLDTEFFLLSTNTWWNEKDATTNAPKFPSQFRDAKVLLKNETLTPHCLVRVTTEPRRGTKDYQPTTQRRTMRMDLKNSPFHMAELAAFMNQATDAKFPAAPSGTNPTSAVSKLAGKDNPFHEAVFKIGQQWYILGAIEANGTLVVQKRAITVTPSTDVPTKDSATGKYSNITIASVGALLSVTDLASAQGVDGKPRALAELVENGVKRLVTDCGFAVSNNNPAADDATNVFGYGDMAPAALFKLDDTALLMEWLLTPGVAFDTDKALQEKIFGKDVSIADPLLLSWRGAKAPTCNTPDLQQAALAPVIAYLHKNPRAYAALAEESAKAAAKDPHAATMAVIKNRGTDAAAKAAFSALTKFDKDAFREVFWGAVLAKCLELSEKVPPLDEAQVIDQLNQMVVDENAIFAPQGTHATAVPGGIAADGVMIDGSDLKTALQQIHKNYKKAHEALWPGGVEGSGLLKAQREVVGKAFTLCSPGYTHKEVQDQLSLAHISLASAEIIAKPNEKPFTDADSYALAAIASTVIVANMQQAIIDNPSISVDELKKNVEDTFAERNAALGTAPHFKLDPAFATSTKPAEVVNLVLKAYADCVKSAQNTTYFSDSLPALNAISDIVVPSGKPPLSAAALAKATLDPNDLAQVKLFPVQAALVKRRMEGDQTACAWQEGRGIKTSDGSKVFEAGSADSANYLSIGLMHFQKQHPSGHLDIQTIDGRPVRWEQCAPPVGQPADHAYYHFTIEKNGKREVFSETREEGRHLRNQVLQTLKTHADDALKQGIGRPPSGAPIHMILPAVDDPHKVYVDTAPVPSSTSKLKHG